MKIVKIHLENVKNHEVLDLNFSEGVNLISGMNGTGKTTILQSIGYCIFNSNPFDNRTGKKNVFSETGKGGVDRFVKWGKKRARIEVTVEFNDEAYKFVRKFGGSSNSAWEVFNSQAEKFLEGTKDVESFIKQKLNLSLTDNLSDVFKNIIGVSQGKITYTFSESPHLRKPIFDTILKLDVYKKAAERLKPVREIVLNKLKSVNEKLAGLNGSIMGYDEVVEEFQALKSDIENSLNIIAGYRENFKEKSLELNSLKEVRDKISNLLLDIKDTTKLISNKNTLIIGIKSNLEEAKAARALILEYKDGYEKYVATGEIMKKLEQSREEFSRLRDKENKIKEKINSENARYSTNKANFEEQINEIKDKLNKIEFETFNKDLEKARLNLEGMSEFKNKLADFDSSKTEFENFYSVFLKTYNDINFELRTYDNNSKEIDSFDNNLISEIEAELEKSKNREGRLNILREEISKLNERKNMLQNGEISNGYCPFSNSDCFILKNELPNLKNKVKKIDSKIEQYNKEMSILKEKLDNKEELVKKYNLFCHQKESREKLIKENKEIQDKLISKYNMITKFKSKEIIERCLAYFSNKDVSIAEFDFKNIDDCSEKLKVYNKQISDKFKHYESRIHEEEMKRRLEYNELSLKIKNLQEQKTNFENNIKQIEQKQKLNENLKEKINLLEKEKDEIDFSKFDNIDQQIFDAKMILTNNQCDYQNYMLNIKTAEKFNEIYEEYNKELLILEELVKEKEIKEKELEDLNKSFDIDVFNNLEKEISGLNDNIVKLEAIMAEKNRYLKEVSERLDKLNRIKLKIEAMEKERTKLESDEIILIGMQDIYKNAGQKMSIFIREELSFEASRIYCEISEQSLKLEWNDDYDIVIYDNYNNEERIRSFSQLSGGEQMTAALAIRLSLLRRLNNIRVGFFDEPTANLDNNRRLSLAGIIPKITNGFDQLFFISHDDSFDEIIENVVSL